MNLMESVLTSSLSSVMHVQFVSQDRELYRLCREILSEITGQRWTLSVASPDTSVTAF